jgi:hypothetical protein
MAPSTARLPIHRAGGTTSIKSAPMNVLMARGTIGGYRSELNRLFLVVMAFCTIDGGVRPCKGECGFLVQLRAEIRWVEMGRRMAFDTSPPGETVIKLTAVWVVMAGGTIVLFAARIARFKGYNLRGLRALSIGTVALDNPEFVQRGLEILTHKAKTLGIDQGDVPDEKSRIKSIMAAAKHREYLNTSTAQHPDGLVAFAIEHDMSESDFLREALVITTKQIELTRLCEGDEEVSGLCSSPPFEGNATGYPGTPSLHDTFYAKFRNLGYSHETAQAMAEGTTRGN